MQRKFVKLYHANFVKLCNENSYNCVMRISSNCVTKIPQWISWNRLLLSSVFTMELLMRNPVMFCNFALTFDFPGLTFGFSGLNCVTKFRYVWNFALTFDFVMFLRNRLLLSSLCQRIWCPGLHKGYQTWFFNDDWLDILRFLRQLVLLMRFLLIV